MHDVKSGAPRLGRGEKEEAMGKTMAGRTKLSRRSFLKATAAAGALGASGVVTLNTLEAAAEEKNQVGEEHKTVCCIGNCSGGCILDATMREGKVCDLKNHELINDRGRENICSRGLSNVYRLYSDRRILYPMRRVGERGENQFERITWDEAIDEICTKWKGYIEQYGPSSVGVFGGSGNQGADGTSDFGVPADGYVSRMISYLNLDKIILDADSAGMLLYAEMLGGSTSGWGNDWLDLPNADNIVVWTCNPSEAMVGRFHNVIEAQNAGARITVIDPVRTITAAKANRFIPIRPGSDGLLAIAIMKKVIAQDLQDKDFLRNHTVGAYLVKDSDGMYLRLSDVGLAPDGGEGPDAPVSMYADGRVASAFADGERLLSYEGEVAGHSVHTAYDLLLERIDEQPYTIDEIVAHTQVEESVIDELVELFTNGNTTLISSYGADHYANGHTFYTNVLTLMMLTGNLGKHGAGVVGPGVSHLLSAAGGDTSAMVAPQGEGLGMSYRIPGNSVKDVVATGKFGDDDLTLKSIYVTASNILGNQSERRMWIDEILPQIEFFVVADIEASDTTKYADLLLPACHWWEQERYWTREGYTAFSEQVHEPLGESMGDLEIYNMILEGMGRSDAVLTREEFMTRAFDNDASREAGISWEEVKKRKLFKTVPDGFVNVNDGTGTTAGRFSFYREGCRPDPDVAGQPWDYLKERMLYWEPPREAWYENEVTAKYPIQFISERSKFKVHTMFSYCENMLEVDSEPYATINPVDAEARGLTDGDYVHVYNDRGDFICRVYLHAGMRPGVIQMDHGWQDEQFVQGHYQDITSNYSGNVAANNCYHDCMVQVEKSNWEG